MKETFIHLLGAGRAGTGITRLLAKAGHRIGVVVATHESSARQSAKIIGAGEPTTEYSRAFEPNAVTILGVPDERLAPLANQAAELSIEWGAVSVLHLSGATSSRCLAPLADLGAAVGSLHPLHSFASRDDPPASLAGKTFAFEGDDAVGSIARHWVKDLGGRLLQIDTSAKPAYHAAASVASNALVTLFDLAVQIAESAGLTEEEAARALLPLMQNTMQNLEAKGSPAALTGPVERGDVEVIRSHMEALHRLSPGQVSLYRALGLRTVRLALEKKSIDEQTAEELRQALEAGP